MQATVRYSIFYFPLPFFYVINERSSNIMIMDRFSFLFRLHFQNAWSVEYIARLCLSTVTIIIIMHDNSWREQMFQKHEFLQYCSSPSSPALPSTSWFWGQMATQGYAKECCFSLKYYDSLIIKEYGFLQNFL